MISRYGPPAVIRAGCSISVLGLVLCLVVLAVGGADVGVGWLVGGLAVVGAGNSMIMTAYLAATLADVRPDQAGIASGTLNTIQQFAGSAGLAAVGAMFFAVLGRTPGPTQYFSATSVALWIGLGLVVVIAGLSWLLRAPAGRRTAEPAPAKALADLQATDIDQPADRYPRPPRRLATALDRRWWLSRRSWCRCCPKTTVRQRVRAEVRRTAERGLTSSQLPSPS